MTREEQIKEKADEYAMSQGFTSGAFQLQESFGYDCITMGFIQGAKFADENISDEMIDKISDWLMENLRNYLHTNFGYPSISEDDVIFYLKEYLTKSKH